LNSHRILSLAVALLLSCEKGQRKQRAPEDSAPTQDTGPATGTSCDSGYLEDEGDCVPAACGTGTWGALELDENTVYVDSTAAEGGDGSQAAPYTSIQAGLDAAGDADGGMVAVAAGSYPETLELGRSHADAHLAGRCKELVIIDASVGDGRTAGIDVDTRSYAVSVSGITVSGSAYVGVLVASGTATMRDCAVLGTGYAALGAYQARTYESSLTAESCEIAGTTGLGLLAGDSGTTVTLRETTIKDTQSAESGGNGYGIDVYGGADLSLESCQVSGNMAVGLFAEGTGTSVTLRETSITDNLPNANEQGGYGVEILDGANLSAEECEVSANTAAGIVAYDSGTTVMLRETTIQGTLPDAHGEGGYGIRVDSGASVEAQACDIAGNTEAGIIATDSGTTVTLWETTVQDTQADEGGCGYGAYVHEGASLTIEAGELSGNTKAGIMAVGSGATVTLQETTIRDTQADEDGNGYGAYAYEGASLAIEASELSGNTRIGIAAHGSDTTVTLRETTIQGTQPDEEGLGGFGTEVVGGANLSAESCLLSDNTGVGVFAEETGTTVTLRETTVRNTQANLHGVGGQGIQIGAGASLGAEDCLLSRNTGSGLVAAGSGTTVRLQGTAIQETQPDETGLHGYGIQISGGVSLEAETCEISRNTSMGLRAVGSGTSVALRETTIRDTQPKENGEGGAGVTIYGGGILEAEACEFSQNRGAGLAAQGPRTSVTLRDTRILDTQPEEDGRYGAGVQVTGGASLVAKACEISGNVSMGIIADGSGTTVHLRDTVIDSMSSGEIYTVGVGINAQESATVEATAVELFSNAGPGLYIVNEGTRLSCTDCTISDNQFAGAVAVVGASLDLHDSIIEGTGEQENLGGGTGIYANPWVGDPPTLSVSSSTIQDNPIAGAWLSGEGPYSFSGNTIRGGEGWTRETLTKCGDAVYASGSVEPGKGSSGLLLENNELRDGLGAGLFLHNASANLSGNTYLDNAVDLISQGTGCDVPPNGYDDAALGSAELCPTYDYATCEDPFYLYLELVEPEPRHPEKVALLTVPGPRPDYLRLLPRLQPARLSLPPRRHGHSAPPFAARTPREPPPPTHR